MLVREVADDEWPIVAWLWQCFRHDLALIVSGLPYPDGRYATRGLPTGPAPDVAGHLAWQEHSRTGEPAPVGFAVVEGLTGARRLVAALWVAPAARLGGVGERLAREVLAAHPPPWAIPFQHDNAVAARFWRRVADQTVGPGRWTEEQRPVPGRPGVPGDHWIETA